MNKKNEAKILILHGVAAFSHFVNCVVSCIWIGINWTNVLRVSTCIYRYWEKYTDIHFFFFYRL